MKFRSTLYFFLFGFIGLFQTDNWYYLPDFNCWHHHSFKRVSMSIVNVIPDLGLAPNSSNWNILPYTHHICSKYIVEAKQMIEGCSGMIDPKIWYNFIWAPSNNYIMLFMLFMCDKQVNKFKYLIVGIERYVWQAANR